LNFVFGVNTFKNEYDDMYLEVWHGCFTFD